VDARGILEALYTAAITLALVSITIYFILAAVAAVLSPPRGRRTRRHDV